MVPLPPFFPVLLPLLYSVPDQNIKQWSCPAVRWERRVPRQAELTAPLAALIPWPGMSQREEGAHPPTAASLGQGVRTEGMVQGKGEGWEKCTQCADLRLLSNPPQLAKLVCLDAAKAVES